jgi:hypothetical protein
MKANRIYIYLVFLTFLSNYIFSQVSFIDLNPDSCVCVTSSNNSYDTLKTYWDIDNDGSNDFIIQSIAWYYDVTHHNNYTNIIPLNNNNVAGDNLNYVLKLNLGDTINNQVNWLSSSGLFLNFILLQGWHGYWHEPANVYNYAAIKFYSGSTLYYGWIKLNAYAYTDSSQVLISEYAYSPSIITAGEGSITSVKESINSNSGFYLYPNPSDGLFKLNFQKNIHNGKIIILNSIGQIAHQQKIEKGENSTISTSLRVSLSRSVKLYQNLG